MPGTAAAPSGAAGSSRCGPPGRPGTPAGPPARSRAGCRGPPGGGRGASARAHARPPRRRGASRGPRLLGGLRVRREERGERTQSRRLRGLIPCFRTNSGKRNILAVSIRFRNRRRKSSAPSSSSGIPGGNGTGRTPSKTPSDGTPYPERASRRAGRVGAPAAPSGRRGGGGPGAAVAARRDGALPVEPGDDLAQPAAVAGTRRRGVEPAVVAELPGRRRAVHVAQRLPDGRRRGVVAPARGGLHDERVGAVAAAAGGEEGGGDGAEGGEPAEEGAAGEGIGHAEEGPGPGSERGKVARRARSPGNDEPSAGDGCPGA